MQCYPPEGASLLAKNVNDNALHHRGALRFFVGTPPGAGSLPQKANSKQYCAQRRRSTPITTSATTTNPSSIPPALMNTWR